MGRRVSIPDSRTRGGVSPWLVFVFVGAAALVVFWPSTANGFVDWDDDKNFLNNLAYRGLDGARLRWMWTTFHLGPYQPLSWMTLGLDYVLWGMQPAGYHRTSVFLHALGAGLFAFVAAKLFDRGAGSGRSSATREASGWQSAAFGGLAGLVWAVHPLRVEAVSWITERREVLCGALSMLALALHLGGKRRGPVIVAALAAMLAKGTAAVLPVLLVLIDVHAEAGERRSAWPAAARRSARRHAPLFAAAIVVGILAIVGQRQAEAVSSLASVGALDRAVLFGHGLVFYAWKTLWPFGLAPLYELHAGDIAVRLSGALGLAGFGLALAAAVGMRERAPALAPLLLAYAALVAPVGGILQVGFQAAADRYAYAAGWALSLAVALGVRSVVLRSLRRRAAAEAPALLAAAFALAVPLAALAVRQQTIWKDAATLWTYELAQRPDTALAHYSLANLRVTRERSREADLWAEPHFREAVRIRPDKPEAYRGLGNVLRRTGRLDEALAVYEAGLARAPQHGPLLYGLATAQWQKGDRDAALATLYRLRDCPPQTADSFIVLARALAAAGRAREAAAQYERAMVAPSDTPAIAPMELAWLLATYLDPSVRDGARALDLARRAEAAGRSLAAQGGLALRSGLEARLARTLAAALAENGRFEEAAAVLRSAAGAFPVEQRPQVEAWIAGFAGRQPIRSEPEFP